MISVRQAIVLTAIIALVMVTLAGMSMVAPDGNDSVQAGSPAPESTEIIAPASDPPVAAPDTVPTGGDFADVDGNVHAGSIEAIAAAGISLGCNPPTNDLYCPSDVMTRGEMAAFLSRALKLTDRADDPYVDDDGSIFEADIERLAAAGITSGCNPPEGDRFCPDAGITRAQAAGMLARGYGYTDGGAGNFFDDDDGSVFEGDIDAIKVAGITQGCNPPANTRFCPDKPVRRDQMASFLARAERLVP